MRIGILGGCFNPVHNGHIHIAREAIRLVDLDRVLFIVSPIPPHKPAGGLAEFTHRFEMARLALEGDRKLTPSDIEAEREGMSYTVTTLRSLWGRWPGSELFFIIGADTLPELPIWRDPKEVLRLAQFVVMYRSGFDLAAIDALADLTDEETLAGIRNHSFEIEPVDVSSTEIRERVKKGESISNLVPEPVAGYIREHGLYS